MRILITGPPAAGKSSLAARLAAEHGAEVIDADAIAQEFGSVHGHDHPPQINSAALVEADRRVDDAAGPLVVVRSAPTPAERQALAARIGADRVIVLDVPAETAKARAVADGRPWWTADAIDRWWADYQPSPGDETGSVEQTPDTSMRPRSAPNGRGPGTGPHSAATGEPMPDPAVPETGAEGTTPPVPPAPSTPSASDPSATSTQPAEPKPTETVDFWKSQARENEKRAKSNASAAKELEQLKASMMSETEKAVAEAEARGRAAAVSEVGQRIAAAEIKAALTGIVPDPGDIVEDLNLARYVTDSGDVDTKAIAALKKKYEALKTPPASAPDPKGRPAENLRKVPVAGGENGPMTDMSAWMRERSQGASRRT